jgi:hypothetical protein
MNLIYQPHSELEVGIVAASNIAYATTNLPFFAGPWRANFIPCSALAACRSGDKLANIIVALHKQENDCVELIVQYKTICRQLTLTDFPSDNNDTDVHHSVTTQGRDRAGSLMPSTLGDSTSRLILSSIIV